MKTLGGIRLNIFSKRERERMCVWVDKCVREKLV